VRDLEQFLRSIDDDTPVESLTAPLEALWWLRKGDWERAHELVQPFEQGAGAWVHAHLHRVEGDAGNAAYWYRRAGRAPSTRPLPDEWAAITAALLNEG